MGQPRYGARLRDRATGLDWRRAAWVSAFALVALPLLLAITLETVLDRPPLTGDLAVTELSVMNASAGKQLAGSYSRLGFSHPGPAQFYLLAPFHRLSGESSTSLSLTTIVCNLAALYAIASTWFTHCRSAAVRTLLLASLSLFLFSFGSVELNYWEILTPLSAFWNPVCVVLPLGALLVLSCSVAAGKSSALPIATAIHAFVVQTHLGTGLVATVFLATAIVMLQRARANSARALIRAQVSAALVAIVLWTPVLLEQVLGSGNLTKLARFAIGPGSVALRDGIVHVALHLSFWSLPLRLEQSSGAMEAAALVLMATQAAC